MLVLLLREDVGEERIHDLLLLRPCRAALALHGDLICDPLRRGCPTHASAAMPPRMLFIVREPSTVPS